MNQVNRTAANRALLKREKARRAYQQTATLAVPQTALQITPQSTPLTATEQLNNAGGFTPVLDDAARLRRFLTLGVDGGTYYVSAHKLALDNAAVVARMAETDPKTLVDTIVEISTKGRAPRQQPALFALAYAASIPEAAPTALAALPLVARTGTHLFEFAGYAQQFRGWGRGLRKAVAKWYTAKEPGALAYQSVKYRQREGWSHRDLLRLAHPKSETPATRATFDWITHGSIGNQTPELITAFLEAQTATDSDTWVRLIRNNGLSWEMLPDIALDHIAVWDAILDTGIGQTALMRQLPRLTRLGMLPTIGGRTGEVVKLLTAPGRIAKGRLHPISLLIAQRTYAAGRSWRGTAEWEPTRAIVDALDNAFYTAFGNVKPSGSRMMLALDVSGSMAAPISGQAITAREASAALALVQLATETQAMAVGFTAKAGSDHWFDGSALTPLSISPRQRLDDAVRAVSDLPFGGTDCALPMIHARDKGLEIDSFVVYTDNETWAGDVHPDVVLRNYRLASGIDAKLVVVGMTATKFTIADPNDPGMLDVAGFDAAVPNLISEFARVA